jgi:hypothetical protein
MKNRTVVFPCRVRQGFFAFMAFFAVYSSAAPQVGYSVVKSGSSCKVRISGSSIGAIKSGEIVCEYAMQLDIDNALVYSPLSSIAVGASVDRVNHKVKIILNTTGKMTIDNAEMIVVDLKLSGSETTPVFGLTSAQFTDPQGSVKSAQILPVGVLIENRVHSNYYKRDQELKYYLLNGKAVPQKLTEQFRNAMNRRDVFLRIVPRR